MNMKNILLPTDFSDNSKHAIEYALKYFSGIKCHFIILNVQKSSDFILDDLMAAKPGTSVHQAIAADNQKLLAELSESLQESCADEEFEFETVFDFDVFVDAVEQIVESRKIDLIVMGTNGASGASEAIFGSNTLKVIRNVDCPLLAIPESYKFNELKHVLFTVINDNFPTAEEMGSLLMFIDRYHPRIELLHISDENGNIQAADAETRMRALLAENNLDFHDVEGIPAPMAINMFVQLRNIDMHAMLVEKKSFLDRFIHGSRTSKISYSTEVPLLVLNR